MGSKTRFYIDASALKQADRCVDSFRCLKDPSHQLCEVSSVAANGKVLFIGSDQCVSCGYRVRFADEVICACPVRQEIYKKYKV